MTSISANGLSQAVYLQQNGGVIEYSVGTLTTPGTYTAISSGNWPVTIYNFNPGASSILRVVATTSLTLTASYGNITGYLIAGSTYITFDGSGNTITLDGITNYLGFIRNGTASAIGKANIVVQNFTTTTSGGSVLSTSAGWLCQSYFGNSALGNSITGCTNSGVISGENCGGIAGSFAGSSSGGSITITNCTNSGNIIPVTTQSGSGGIVGSNAGRDGGSITFTNCTNSGNITQTNAGGISGFITGGGTGSSATFTNCTNSGDISGNNSVGGISGYYVALNAGSATYTNCTNSGLISTLNGGGIVGQGAGYLGGTCTITKCFNTGNITGQYSGGIAGPNFAYDTSQPCRISNCYSNGAISGNKAGGIVGANVGFSDNALYTASVDISNCYSLGTIATATGGICGGWNSTAYTNKATIGITNCYSYGVITSGGAGIVAPSLTSTQINLTQTNTYIANGTWSDSTANANLTGYPTNINTSNPGSTWTMITAGTPYVLSAYNAALYSPSSASSSNTYTSAQGLFQPGYTYQILYTSQAGNVATTRVFASKGTAPYYDSYNSNTFSMTNLSVTSLEITATINASTGVLDFILPKYPCFLEGTKILCFENNQEVYREIESLRKGDLVKTTYNGYRPIYMIGTTALYNPGNDYRVANRIYKCPKEKYPTLFEDLYITGCHSILVPSMTDDQWENTKAVNGNIYVTDNHFRLIACADEKAEPFNKEGFMNIYHIALDHHDICMNYGIYANGLLVESCSIEYLIKYSNLKIVGQEDCVVSENVGNVLIRHLVETY